MHANRNKKAVKRVEKGMMKANRIRNLFAVFGGGPAVHGRGSLLASRKSWTGIRSAAGGRGRSAPHGW